MNQVIVKKQWFIKSNNGRVDENYEIDAKKVLGSGNCGQVVKARIKNTKTYRAIKIIPKAKVKSQELFTKEIDILRTLDHPNVIKLYEIFEDQRNIYLVMELCEGGELFERILERGHQTEKEALDIFTQLLQAVHYCHQNGICHRDLKVCTLFKKCKPENCLMLSKAEETGLKIIGFATSAIFQDMKIPGNKKAMTTRTMSPYYMAPEVIVGEYSQACDIWSLGVILYILLTGIPPFDGNSDAEILDNVSKLQFNLDLPELKVVSPEAKKLLQAILTTSDKRITGQGVMNHPWLSSNLCSQGGLPINFGQLKNFTQFNKLKKVTLTFMASQLSDQEISQLGNAFKKIDKNGDGVLTMDEMKIGVQGFSNQTQKDIQEIIKNMDTDASGTINYTEFIAATIEKKLYMQEEKIVQAFKMFDLDGSGKISKDELQEVLGKFETYKNVKSSFWDDLIKEADKNGDGQIDYSEFVAMMDFIKL